jgi:hypothetical protein
MKITGPNGTGSAGGPRTSRATGPGGSFRLPEAASGGSAPPAAGVARTAGVMGVDALLALQGGSTEGRRRSVRRAGRILDVLEEIKLALLDGRLSPLQLDRLKRAVHDERALTGDLRLEGVLDEIELRAAVEIAKLEQAAARAA